MKYTHILADFCTKAWAIREETLIAMRDVLRLQVSGVKWNTTEIRERIDAANEKTGTHAHVGQDFQFLAIEATHGEIEARRGGSAGPSGTVALIPIVGIISHRMNMMGDISGPGGTSIQKLTGQFRQAMQDPNCKAIVFDVDSPGGSVEGVPELAAEILEGRKRKPITAVFNSMGCSAAYWLASAASEVVCTMSGQCGSIGVYMVHQDESKALENEGVKITMIKAGKFKTEGDPSQPLSDEARAAFQSKVDDYYGMFIKAVAQNRSTSQAKVKDGYGEGRSLLAGDAVKANLADRTGTLDDVLAKYGVKSGGAIQMAASTSSPSLEEGKLEVIAAAPVPDDGDGDNDTDKNDPCGCACNACKACTGAPANSKAKTDDMMGCACACNACQACDFNKGAKSVINAPIVNAQLAATAEEQKAAQDAAGDILIALRARRHQLSLH
jgi:signal peptide peptidase SppA